MKVTPVDKKFGKYLPGEVFTFPDKPARVFIKLGKLREADDVPVPQTYQNRMMTSAPAAAVDPAPFGYKADGTPRLRPAYNVRKAED